jgi:hypothetical protein
MMKKVVAERMVQFGSAGQASRIRAKPLSEMAKYYS